MSQCNESMTIRVSRNDVILMRSDVKTDLLKIKPELKGVKLSDAYLFNKIVEFALE